MAIRHVVGIAVILAVVFAAEGKAIDHMAAKMAPDGVPNEKLAMVERAKELVQRDALYQKTMDKRLAKMEKEAMDKENVAVKYLELHKSKQTAEKAAKEEHDMKKMAKDQVKALVDGKKLPNEMIRLADEDKKSMVIKTKQQVMDLAKEGMTTEEQQKRVMEREERIKAAVDKLCEIIEKQAAEKKMTQRSEYQQYQDATAEEEGEFDEEEDEEF
ncbi:Hypp8908 [Branchiostoma lanceolatum]|uniref:Hypp8908 protein n=1 Tax=Branchiostoma lanceolatum TaxID=7740 RepID=A0A8K0EJ56_BRALA|nr:Hypp8908 [Branchiostoma lanceolatum]